MNDKDIKIDILRYLTDKVIRQEYFPTYEQMWYESVEVLGLMEPKYREIIDQLKKEGVILSKKEENNIERLYPFPNTIILAKAVAKIILRQT